MAQINKLSYDSRPPANLTLSAVSAFKFYIITMRPYLMFVSGITGIAGLSFSDNLSLLQTIAVFFASFFSYGFGQALTDCFQIDTDSISSPYRPLTQGKISKSLVLIISAAGLILCILVFTVYNSFNLILGIISGIGLATYTYFKRRWWGGPFYNAWIVSVLFIMAFLSSAGQKLSFEIVHGALAVFFGYSNFVLSGYFKDITADEATGYNTLPVKFGRKISAAVSSMFAFLMIIFSSIIIFQKFPVLISDIPSLLFFLLGFTAASTAQYRLHKVQSDEDAYKAILPVVHSYILILSSIALSQKPGWLIPLLVFYFGFSLILKLRPSKQQI
ncbi:MAG: UbiA family prenyltransferase [Ignavibacteria bacterium]